MQPGALDAWQARLALLEQLARHGELVEALLREAEQTDPATAMPLLQRAGAIAEGRMEDHARAAAIYRRLLALDPNSREAAEALARAAAQSGDTEGVVAALEAQLADLTAPAERAELLAKLGQGLAEQPGRQDDAIERLEEALSLRPEDPATMDVLSRCYFTAERWPELVELYRKLLALTDDPGAQAAIQSKIGEIAQHKLHDAGAAEAAYREVLRCRPEAREAWGGLRAIALERGDAAAAVDAARREADFAPLEERPALLVAAGVLASERLDNDELAAGLFRDVLSAAPAHGDARERLVGILLRSGAKSEAASVLVAAAGAVADAGEAIAIARRAADLLRAEEDLDGAARALEAGLARDPDAENAGQVRDDLAHIYNKLGRYEDVVRLHLAEADRETDAARRAAQLREAAEVLYRRAGDPEQASRILRSVTELAPRDGSAWRLLGETAASAHDHAAVVDAARGERATDPGPDRSLELWQIEARACSEPLGRFDEAITAWRAVILAGPAVAHEIEALDQLLAIARKRNDLAGVADAAVARAQHAHGADGVPLLREAVEAAEQSGDAARALRAVRDWVSRTPQELDALQAMARVARQAEDPVVEADALGLVAEHAPEPEMRASALRRRATLLSTHGRPLEAAEALRALLQLRPDRDTREEAVRLFGALGDDAAVEQVLREWADGEPDPDARLPVMRRLLDTLLVQPEAAVAAEAVAREVLELSPADPATVRACTDLCLARGAVDDAVEVLTEAASEAADHLRGGMLRRAAELLEARGAKGDAKRAADLLDGLLRADASDGRAREARARIATAAGDLQTARQHRAALLEAAAEPGDRVAASLALGAICERLELTEEAIAAYEAGREADPASPAPRTAMERLYERLGRQEELRALLEDEAGSGRGTPLGRAALWMRAARISETAGDARGAVGAYAAALDAAPDWAPAARGLRRAAAAAGDDDLQLAATEAEARLTPDGPGRARLLAAAGLERLRRANAGGKPQGDRKAAREALEEAFRLGTTSADALGALRELRRTNEDSAGAVAAGRAEADRRSGAARVEVLLAIAALAREGDDAESARRFLGEAIETAPEDPAPVMALVELERGGGDPGRLAAALALSADLGAGSAELWREAAQAATAAGDGEAAVRHWAAALELEPSGPHAAGALAAWDALLVELGREAERPDLLARRAAVAGGGKPAAACWLERAELLLRIRPEDAAASFRAAAACDPEDPEPWARLFDLAEAQDDAVGAAEAARRLAERASGAESKRLSLRVADHCEQIGDLRGAADAVRRALAAAGADERIPLHQRLVDLTERFNDPLRTAEACEAAAAACDAPGEADAAADWLVQAAELRRTQLGQDVAALELLERAAARAPGHRAAVTACADALREVGRTREAADAYARARDLAPEADRPALERGRGRLLLEELGDAAAAADALAAARTGAPDNLELRGEWQRALDQAGRWAELADALEEELELDLDPDRARAARKEFVGVIVDALDDAPRAVGVAEAIVADGDADAQAVAWAAKALAGAGRVEAAASAHLQLRDRLDDPAARATEAVRAGELLRGAGSRMKARAAFESAVEDQPGHLDALRAVADLAEVSQDWPAVAAACRRLVEAAGEGDAADAVRVEALGRLGAVQVSGLKDAAGARASYEQALALAPDRAALRAALVHTLESLQDFDAVLALHAADPARARGGAEAAAVLAREGVLLAGPMDDGKAAESRFRDALARDPDCLPALRGLRDLLASRPQPPSDELADLWERVGRVGNAASRAGALTQAADLRAGAGDDTRAADTYRAALEVDPMHPGALAGLGRLLVRQETWEPAADVCARWEDALGAGGATAERAEAAWLRGRAGAASGESPGVTASHFARAVAAQPDHEEAQRDLGEALTEAGKFGDAVKVLGTVLEQAARSGDAERIDRAGRFLARAHLGAGDAKSSAAAWRGVLESAGAWDAEASAGLARAESAQGNHAAAAAAWTDAAEAAPEREDRLEALIESAASWERAGDPAKAMEQAAAACAEGGAATRPARERWMRLAMKAEEWATVRAEVAPLCEPAEGADAASVVPWLQLAAAAENRGGDPVAALELHRRAFAADPAQLKSLEAAVRLLDAGDGADAATDELEAGLALHEAARPGGGPALRMKLAERHRVAKRPEEAVAHLQAVLAQQPDDVNAHVALARVLASRRSTLPAAAAEHQWLLEREPLRLASYRALEKIFGALNDTRRAPLAAQAAAAAAGEAVDDGAVLEPDGKAAPRRLDAVALEPVLAGEAGELLGIVAPTLYKVHRPDLTGAAGRRDQPPAGFARIERLAAKVGALLGAGDALQVSWAPGIDAPMRLEPSAPPTLLVGPGALPLHEGVLRFLFGRAVFLASHGWTLVDALERRDGEGAVEGLLRDTVAGYVPDVEPGEPGLVKKVRGAVARKRRKEVEALCEALGDAMEDDAEALAGEVLQALGVAGVRAGLVANGGDLGGAVEALSLEHDGASLPELAAVWPPAAEIARFAVSDAFASLTESFAVMDDSAPAPDPESPE
ncbi:MAG: hypothetical protein ACYTGX_04380 [Planctomycetota bacterium]